MAGTLQTTPWAFAPYGTLGSFASVPGNLSAVPIAGILQQLQIVPQQLQQVQQAEYVQQQQLQQILQVLQYVPQQVQQVLQLIQYLPQHVAQLVQQALASPSVIPPGFGTGAISPFAGISTTTPLQSPVFGSPVPSWPPLTSTPFPVGQPGYVM